MIKYLKYLLCNFEWKTITKLSVYEIRRLFRCHIESTEDFNKKGKNKHSYFVGEIKETGFEVYRYSSWRCSFARPVIKGYFYPHDSGSELRAVIQIPFSRFVRSILVLLSLIALQFLFIYYFVPNNNDINEIFTFGLPFLLTGLVVMTVINYWYEVLNSISIMQVILKKERL